MTTTTSPKRILVTGGAGFLGSHLCERLLAEGHQVVCLDNFSSGSLGNIAALLGHPAFSLLQQDVVDPIGLLQVDQVYNLASIASPQLYQRNPVQTLKTNVLGAMQVLDLALRCGARVLQASTSEVYGDPLVHPQPESYLGNVNPIGPRACYDEGKRCAETLFADYQRQHGLSIKIVRIFNTYGPRMLPGDGRVISSFFAHAQQGSGMPIHGDGQQTRSFCYVSDMVEGLMRMMISDAAITGPLNLGNPEEIDVLSLARKIAALTGSAAAPVFRPGQPDDPRQRKPDISQAWQLLGWAPQVTLDNGLSHTHAQLQRTAALATANRQDPGADALLRGHSGLPAFAASAAGAARA
ncbi:SDR family oxidoreductase [Comamonas piscis]|uniref:SDR family oxidoreductase n=1 Tax=Comamonas piscis TaxID=1562974 RepID=A0A7G5EHL6_9BURK|nr:UDP-glucuronic acid decarboxylase family protein [Comamonas piscis]QMV73491.1 SDR family oxidoreductase [Comamonas piscis]WSO31908.1 UDP-glucuronic acid decarboxylase family protein [Comamonas piscis]